MSDGEALVAFGVPTAAAALTLTIVAMKNAAREREMRHTERLKAIENGLLLDDVDEERRIRRGMLKLAGGLGIGVPAIAVASAAAALINVPAFAMSPLTVFLIWTGAAAVGLAAVVSGAWLANATLTRLRPAGRHQVGSTAPNPRANGNYDLAGAQRFR